jgi:hypothetical protein
MRTPSGQAIADACMRCATNCVENLIDADTFGDDALPKPPPQAAAAARSTSEVEEPSPCQIALMRMRPVKCVVDENLHA